MRAWILSCVVVVLACGDSAAPTDGGNGGSSGNPSTSGQATSNDSATSVATSAATGEQSTGAVDSSTGEPPLTMCIENTDCVLIDSCNTCGANLPGNGAPEDSNPDSILGGAPARLDIPPACEMTQCEQWGDPMAECRFGQCVLSKLHCGLPGCDGVPPSCDSPLVPLVDPATDCWSGNCGPASACDYVSACFDCDVAGLLCVQFEGETQPTCEAVPPDCDGTAECDCAGAIMCGEASCSVDRGGIVCGA